MSSLCHPEDVRDCLAAFEQVFALCAETDLNCQCETVIQSGTRCFDSCPEEAMDAFVRTFAEGVCAEYTTLSEDVYSSLGTLERRSAEPETSQLMEISPTSGFLFGAILTLLCIFVFELLPF